MTAAGPTPGPSSVVGVVGHLAARLEMGSAEPERTVAAPLAG